ncbi:hypothetical protein ACFL1R_08890 [Candidatus Latescibacterota bacterium]
MKGRKHMTNFHPSYYLSPLTRRQLLGIPLASALTGMAGNVLAGELKKAAVVTTVYYRWGSHSEWIVGRLLDGYFYYGKHCDPRVEVVSMYTDQVPENDMSREKSTKHGFTIYPTIRETLTLGGEDLAVDGVLLIGEHGNYHWNIKEQKLYPRWYFYKQIIDVFRETGRTVPVFNDKHFSVEWNEAKWMYDQSREMGFPLMAGSSVPVEYRNPPLEFDLETPIEKAVLVYRGGKESHGFHALDVLQCMVERRKGGETGIASVQCLENMPVWKWTDANPWAGRLLNEALSRCSGRKPGNPRDIVKRPIIFLLNYNDGFQAAVYLLNGLDIGVSGFAAEVRGKSEPDSTEFWICLRPGKQVGSSAFVHYIEEMIITGKPSYPVERTLLATGALAALMDSSYENGQHSDEGRLIKTPHLNITYTAQKESLYNRGSRPPVTDEPW